METALVKNQFVVCLRNRMAFFIVAESKALVLEAMSTSKFLETQGGTINVADISCVMTPEEWETQKRYQRGEYQKNGRWLNARGEPLDLPDEEKYSPDVLRARQLLTPEERGEA